MKIIELKQRIVDYSKPPFTTRKIVSISVVILILIFLIILLLTLVMDKTQNTTPQNVSSKQATVLPTTVPSNSFAQGGRYQATTYSIAYPKGSQNSLYTFPEGTTFLTMPPGYPGEPIFDVEAYNSSQSLARKQVLYIAEGAKKSTLVINNTSLPELSNTYKTRVIDSKPVRTPTQLRLAYLVKPNALYVFRMYYSSSVSVPEDEALFAQFIRSFTLK